MPDLEQQIAEWRRQMLAAGIKTPVPMDELESHLREDIERQMRSGLNEQQAFEAAVRGIGQTAALKTEFAKVSETKLARQRRMHDRFFAAVLVLYALIFGRVLLINPEVNLRERLLGFASLAATAVLALAAGRYAPRIFPVIRNHVLRSVFQFACGISGVTWVVIFAWFIPPRFEFTQGQLLVAILWGFVPALVLPAMFVGFDKVEGRLPTTAGS